MVANKTETRNFSAISQIIDAGRPVTVMTMSANVSTDVGLNFSSTVRDMDMYFANQQEVDADFDSWKEEITEIVKGE